MNVRAMFGVEGEGEGRNDRKIEFMYAIFKNKC